MFMSNNWLTQSCVEQICSKNLQTCPFQCQQTGFASLSGYRTFCDLYFAAPVKRRSHLQTGLLRLYQWLVQCSATSEPKTEKITVRGAKKEKAESVRTRIEGFLLLNLQQLGCNSLELDILDLCQMKKVWEGQVTWLGHMTLTATSTLALKVKVSKVFIWAQVAWSG